MKGKDDQVRKKRSSVRSFDEIPEVLRDSPSVTPAPSNNFPLMVTAGLMGLGLLVLLGVFLVWRPFSPSVETPTAIASPDQPKPTVSPSVPEVDNVLGHLPYKEAPASELKAITPDGRIKLRQAAANQFLQMQRDARASGVILVPISGFRGIQEQNYLFFGVKQQRSQDARKRAEVSAPPGYSEHHTGYAFDVGDGKNPGANLKQSFDQTAAFNWMENNAAKYSFEMSFPKDSPQGISYEPWHWRYVGDRESLEMFYKARNLREQ